MDQVQEMEMSAFRDSNKRPIQINANDLGGNSDDINKLDYIKKKNNIQSTHSPKIKKSKT